jgi:hypothetical protein
VHICQDYLVEAGYKDTGGRSYPPEKEELLLKPTMILEYSKEIRPKLNEIKSNIKESVTLSPMETLLVGIDDLTNLSFENVTWNNMGNNSENPITRVGYSDPSFSGPDIDPSIVSMGEESMEGLMHQLFSALHSEKK